MHRSISFLDTKENQEEFEYKLESLSITERIKRLEAKIDYFLIKKTKEASISRKNGKKRYDATLSYLAGLLLSSMDFQQLAEEARAQKIHVEKMPLRNSTIMPEAIKRLRNNIKAYQEAPADFFITNRIKLAFLVDLSERLKCVKENISSQALKAGLEEKIVSITPEKSNCQLIDFLEKRANLLGLEEESWDSVLARREALRKKEKSLMDGMTEEQRNSTTPYVDRFIENFEKTEAEYDAEYEAKRKKQLDEAIKGIVNLLEEDLKTKGITDTSAYREVLTKILDEIPYYIVAEIARKGMDVFHTYVVLNHFFLKGRQADQALAGQFLFSSRGIEAMRTLESIEDVNKTVSPALERCLSKPLKSHALTKEQSDYFKTLRDTYVHVTHSAKTSDHERAEIKLVAIHAAIHPDKDPVEALQKAEPVRYAEITEQSSGDSIYDWMRDSFLAISRAANRFIASITGSMVVEDKFQAISASQQAAMQREKAAPTAASQARVPRLSVEEGLFASSFRSAQQDNKTVSRASSVTTLGARISGRQHRRLSRKSPPPSIEVDSSQSMIAVGDNNVSTPPSAPAVR